MAFFSRYKLENSEIAWYGSPEPKMIIFVLATSLWHEKVVQVNIMQGMWVQRRFSEGTNGKNWTLPNMVPPNQKW
jgi:hypothetical protein